MSGFEDHRMRVASSAQALARSLLVNTIDWQEVAYEFEQLKRDLQELNQADKARSEFLLSELPL